ncbi:RES family NAD+ phosphorylase [Roseivirga sp. BDSF3-8]|uniref:RES family NAD+ phosphorylase n=1 Tax=Roseivirga sp. BDSF3-8 TaxID=3241598 RepID=UPI0035319284
MELFRISAEKFSHQLSASGASNRWNKRGEFVIYTGGSRSLSTLELVVHRNAVRPDIPYRLMIISVPDADTYLKTLPTTDLPANWRKFEAYSRLQEIGSRWYASRESLILKVPSAIIPSEHNYIINTKHEAFEEHVKLVRTEKYFWDDRLL